MNKKYTLLAIIGLATMATTDLIFFICDLIYSYLENVPSVIFRIIRILNTIGPFLVLPFFINLYKNQK